MAVQGLRPLLTLQLLLLILLTSDTYCYTPPAPLDRVAYDILHSMDPDKDPFLSLRMHERESYLSDIDTSKDLGDMVDSIVRFEDKTLVQVKLVGLDDIKANDLVQYMDALNTLDPLHTLDGKSNNTIIFSRETMLTVKHAPSSLLASISNAVSQHLSSSSNRVPYSIVDDIIRDDFTHSESQSHTIYILNLPRQKYDYSYMQYETGKNPSRGACLTSLWSGKERYTWVDMRAGPVLYGPLVLGEGFIDRETLPYAEKYESFKSGQVKVDIAAHVYQTHRHLIAPSLLTRYPKPWTVLDVHLVMIHDHDVGGFEESELFNWQAIQDQILRMPILNGQRINFIKSEKSLLTDETCALIKASSLKSYANEQRTSKDSKVVTNHYLDSNELHDWFSRYKNQLIGQTRQSPELTIPIFLFDISYKKDIILLDRAHQAVSFEDMVIAIQTQLPPIESDYGCNGNTIRLEPKDATRPILAALLQSIWGIAPTHQTWNRVQKRVESNYLWSPSLTPFAPFSIHTNLSFAHGDAAARHLLYTHIQTVLGPLADKLEHFMDYSLEMGDILDEQEYLEFIHRWNFLHFKLYQVKKYLTLNLFNASLAFIRSAEHDTKAISLTLLNVHDRVHSFLKCGEIEVDYVSIGSVTLTLVMGVIAVVLLARRLVKKWKKTTSSFKKND